MTTAQFKTDLEANFDFVAGIAERYEEARDALIAAREPKNCVKAKRKLLLVAGDLYEAFDQVTAIIFKHDMRDEKLVPSSAEVEAMLDGDPTYRAMIANEKAYIQKRVAARALRAGASLH